MLKTSMSLDKADGGGGAHCLKGHFGYDGSLSWSKAPDIT
jgi:hypothetical protein